MFCYCYCITLPGTGGRCVLCDATGGSYEARVREDCAAVDGADDEI